MNIQHINSPHDSPKPASRSEFIVTTYLHLGAAVLAFVAISAILMGTGVSTAAAHRLMTSGNQLVWLGVMGAFMLVGWMASSIADCAENPATQRLGLGIYVLAESLIFSPMFGIAHLVAPGAIGTAAVATAVLVAALTWVAYTSKSDFSFLGGALKVGGLVALGTIVAGAIFGFSLGVWFSGLMILFAGLCVLYDTARILRDYPIDRPAGAALHLFASIALMLWYVLRILISLATEE